MRNLTILKKKEKGITLIALVITIIILLILAAITIALLTGENGILTKAIKAKEETEIKGYYEQIELKRMELKLQNENYESPSIYQMEEALTPESWVNKGQTGIITDEGREKLQLTTKEGYIFYITETGTEYKGKGKVVDTSALQDKQALTLSIVGDGKNGKLVQIVDNSKKDYYQIEYQIDSQDGEWFTIKSGETVEVGYSSTIHARLTYITSKGTIVSLSIEASKPTVIAKDIDTSNLVRKTDIPLNDLFEITWGSDGIGSIEYDVTGNLTFKEKPLDGTKIHQLAELEVGNYRVTCKVTSPTNNLAEATKENVKITKLAPTNVVTLNNQSVSAYAIYSEYDLAYFRDLVNNGKQFEINGKVMNTINLSNVCSESVGNWEPIGGDNFNGDETSTVYYNGIFDGQEYKIENLFINCTLLRRQGLFSKMQAKGTLKNIEISGNITAGNPSGICSMNNGGTIINCINHVNLIGNR